MAVLPLDLDRFLDIFRRRVNVQDSASDYVELEVEQKEKPAAKVYVKCYNLAKQEESSNVLNDIRSGYTLSFIKIKEMRDKGGIDELKRTISRLKKSADAADAQIVGVDEDYLLVVPNFVRVEKGDILAPKQ